MGDVEQCGFNKHGVVLNLGSLRLLIFCCVALCRSLNSKRNCLVAQLAAIANLSSVAPSCRCARVQTRAQTCITFCSLRSLTRAVGQSQYTIEAEHKHVYKCGSRRHREASQLVRAPMDSSRFLSQHLTVCQRLDGVK